MLILISAQLVPSRRSPASHYYCQAFLTDSTYPTLSDLEHCDAYRELCRRVGGVGWLSLRPCSTIPVVVLQKVVLAITNSRFWKTHTRSQKTRQVPASSIKGNQNSWTLRCLTFFLKENNFFEIYPRNNYPKVSSVGVNLLPSAVWHLRPYCWM